MRSIRTLLVLVGSLALLGAASACGPAVAAESKAWVEVSPSSASPGDRITVRAHCQTSASNAIVVSSAFGSTALVPTANVLSATVQVSTRASSGTHEITLTCGSGKTAATTLLVRVTVVNKPTVGPHTGGGYLATHPADADSVGPGMWFGGGAVALTAAILVKILHSIRRRRPFAGARAHHHG